jgi:hypothetical protein
MRQLTIKFLILICVLFTTTIVSAQTNLLLNGQADSKTEHWDVLETTVEEFNGDKVFVFHNGGSLRQLVKLTDAAVGKYVLFIGRISSEGANVVDKSNTNLPLIFVANLIPSGSSKGKGQIIRDDAKGENDWDTIYTIYQLTNKGIIECWLLQHREQNVPNEGSAVRFDNLGLYLFETKEDALKFAKAYK